MLAGTRHPHLPPSTGYRLLPTPSKNAETPLSLLLLMLLLLPRLPPLLPSLLLRLLSWLQLLAAPAQLARYVGVVLSPARLFVCGCSLLQVLGVLGFESISLTRGLLSETASGNMSPQDGDFSAGGSATDTERLRSRTPNRRAR